jgi:hypothetical protein
MAACALLAPLSALAQDGKPYAATLETGAAGINVKDDITRVNEYTRFRGSNGVNPYGKVELEYNKNGVVFEGSSQYYDAVDQDHSASLDVKRVFKTDFSYSVLQHWLDHDRMKYLDAAIPATPLTPGTPNPLGLATFAPGSGVLPAGITLFGPNGAIQVINQNQIFVSNANTNTLSPNFVPAFLVTDKSGATFVTNVAPQAGFSNPNFAFQQIGRAAVFGEDLVPNEVFKVKRSELVSKSDLTLPMLPNFTFHFKFRNEDRNGLKQSIGMSKCTSCHLTGQSKEIDENTRDLTAGVTGKFGLLTLDYSFMNRQFREDGRPPTRIYDPALSPGAAFPANTPGTTISSYFTAPQGFDNRLLYDFRNGPLRYDETPDSDKFSNVAKAKLDLPGNTTVMASYVQSRVDSIKTGEAGLFSFNELNKIRLKTDYDAYGGKISTVLGKRLTLSVHGRTERIRDDDVTLKFDTLPLNTIATQTTFVPVGAPNAFQPTAASLNPTRVSTLTRDTANAGIDAVYRLAMRTTLRLGYDYKLEDRHLEELGKTTTHTVKAALNTRPTKSLSGRVTASYKNIDNPYKNHDAALTPKTDNTFGTTVASGATYGTALYDRRTADLTNQPDHVIDGTISTTWSPTATTAVTAMYHVKREENDLSKSSWHQDTHGPGFTVWYAPNNKMNMTLSYNYLNQSSGTAFCQGWYDG